MKTLRIAPLVLLGFTLSPLLLQAAEDAELRKPRMAAQQERQGLKNGRNRGVQDATRQFREFVNSPRTETREEERELGTGFGLERAEINADHQVRMAKKEVVTLKERRKTLAGEA